MPCPRQRGCDDRRAAVGQRHDVERQAEATRMRRAGRDDLAHERPSDAAEAWDDDRSGTRRSRFGRAHGDDAGTATSPRTKMTVRGFTRDSMYAVPSSGASGAGLAAS